MPATIRVIGALWAAAFGLGCLAFLFVPSFMPLSWLAALPVAVRFALFAVYMFANLGAGAYAAAAGPERRPRAAAGLSVASLALTAVFLTSAIRLGTGSSDALRSQASSFLAALAALTTSAGIAATVSGIRVRRHLDRAGR